MKKLILDTSLFVNPASAHAFGSSPTEAFQRFLEMASTTKDLEFLMPPSVYTELMHFAEESKIPKTLLAILRQQPPKKHEIRVPGIFIYKLVEEIRDRSDRGLRLAERHVREALDAPRPEKIEDAKKRADSESISRLRESYRRMMREGMLDSRPDVDLLLLAYEIGGILISADAGVVAWADALGVEILPFDQLPALVSGSSSSTSGS